METPRTTVVMVLDGPMQAWGTSSAFERRDSAPVPTKSGVVGLIACCMGRDRSEDIGDLAALDFAVRQDQPGVIGTDFQTIGIGGWVTASMKVVSGQPKLSTRQYIEGAVFTVALGCPDEETAAAIQHALNYPVWRPFLGRRTCPPARRLYHTTTDMSPLDTLVSLPYQGHGKPLVETRIIYSDPAGTERWDDQPVSYKERQFAGRRTSTVFVNLTPQESDDSGNQTEFDDDPYGIS